MSDVPDNGVPFNQEYSANRDESTTSRGRGNRPQRGRGGGRGGREGGGQRGKGPKKPALTHFLCIPLVNDGSRATLSRALERFKEDVCRQGEGSENASGGSGAFEPLFPAKAVRPVGTLHLTLGVMSLETEERVEKALKYLETIDLQALMQDAVSTNHTTLSSAVAQTAAAGEAGAGAVAGALTGTPAGALAGTAVGAATGATAGAVASAEKGGEAVSNARTISLRSLSAMKSAKDTSVLYAIPTPTTPSFPLYNFCNNLRKAFTEERLLIAEERPLKLHATIVNTIYAKNGGRHGDKGGKDENGKGKGRSGPLKFDGRDLIEKYKDWVWADGVEINKVAICKMGAKKYLDENGEVIAEEYEVVGSRELPP